MTKQLKGTVVSFETSKLHAVVSDERAAGDPRRLLLGEAATKEVGAPFGVPVLDANGRLDRDQFPGAIGDIPDPAMDGSDDGKALVVVGSTWGMDTVAGGGGGQSLYILPESYSGTTEAKLNAAIAAAISGAKPLYLGGAYSISSALTQVDLTANQRLDVIGPGVITIAANIARPIVVTSVWPTPTAVTSATLTTFTMDNGTSATECVAVTSPGHGCSVNEIVKWVADDAIPGEISTDRRVGEFFRVGAVSGDVVYLAGRPIDAFTTGMRLQRVPTDRGFSWDGPRINHTTGQTWTVNALTVRGIVGAKVNAAISNGYSCGLQLQSCVMAECVVDVRDMLNRITSASISGYGVQDCCGWLNEIEVRGSNARHFYTTGTLTAAAGSATYQYGRTVNARITGSVMASTSAAFDLHSSAFGCVIHDATVTGGSAGENGSGVAFQLRGRNNRVVDCSATGSAHGVQIWAQNALDGWDNSVENFDYSGAGDGIRVGAESGVQVRRAKVIGGEISCGDNLRSIYAAQVDHLHIEGTRFRPTGATSGSNLLTLGASVGTVWIEAPKLNTSRFSGADYDLIAFSSGVTAADIVLAAPSVDDPDDRIRSWVNGNGATGVTVVLAGLPEGVTPTGGVSINDTGLTVTVRTGNALTVDGLEAAIEEATDAIGDPDNPSRVGQLIYENLLLTDPDKLFSRAQMVSTFDAAASDTVDGVTIGNAITDSYAVLAPSDHLLRENTKGSRMGKKPMFAPISGLVLGDILVVGADLDTNVAQVAAVTPSIITQPANSFPHVAADSLVEYLTAAAFLTLLEDGLPFNNNPVTPVSNVITYDAYQFRRSSASITANTMLNPSIWNATRARMFDAELTISVGGTARTLDVGTVSGTQSLPADGLIVQAGGATVTLPLTLAANSVNTLVLGKRLGGIPILRLIGEGYSAVVPAAFYVSAATPDVGTPGARSITSGNMPAGVAAGDLLVAIAYNSAGTTSPAITGFTNVSGIGGDGTTPGITIATKVAVGGDTVASPANCAQLHCLCFRKAGGTPSVQATVGYAKTALASTASITWPAITATNKGVILGINAFVSTDGPVTGATGLRSELGSPIYAPVTSQNRVYIGIANVAASDAWGTQSTSKDGVAARELVAEIAIY